MSKTQAWSSCEDLIDNVSDTFEWIVPPILIPLPSSQNSPICLVSMAHIWEPGEGTQPSQPDPEILPGPAQRGSPPTPVIRLGTTVWLAGGDVSQSNAQGSSASWTRCAHTTSTIFSG